MSPPLGLLRSHRRADPEPEDPTANYCPWKFGGYFSYSYLFYLDKLFGEFSGNDEATQQKVKKYCKAGAVAPYGY